MGRGSEVKVYGTSSAVVKVWDPRADIPPAKELLYRAALPQIKAGMGGLVVPFEEVDTIRAYEVQGRRWFFWENRVPIEFKTPVVQERVTDSDDLHSTLRSASTTSEISHYLDLVLAWMQVSIERGFFPHDVVSDNFVVSRQNILLKDLGAVHGQFTGRRNILRNRAVLEEFARNAAASYAPSVKDPSLVSAFRGRLTRILTGAQHNLRKKPSDAYPVPDLVL